MARVEFQGFLRRFPQAAGNLMPIHSRHCSDSTLATGTICQRTHCIVWDSRNSGFAGMTPRQEYLLRAAELSAKAQVENDHACKVEFQNLARAYLRLAKQAERNSQTDIVYETPQKMDGDQA